MNLGNILCLIGGLFVGSAATMLAGIILTNRDARQFRAARAAQARDDAAFGPTDHPLDRAIDEWRKS